MIVNNSKKIFQMKPKENLSDKEAMEKYTKLN